MPGCPATTRWLAPVALCRGDGVGRCLVSPYDYADDLVAVHCGARRLAALAGARRATQQVAGVFGLGLSPGKSTKLGPPHAPASCRWLPRDPQGRSIVMMAMDLLRGSPTSARAAASTIADDWV